MKGSILLISLWFLAFGVQGQEIINTPNNIRYGVNYSDVFRIDTISGIILSTKDSINITVTKGYSVHPHLHISYMHYKYEYFDINWKPINGIVLNFTPYKEEE